MLKKLGTAALVATLGLLGFQASPAQAAPLDASAEAQAGAYTNYYFSNSSNQIVIPSGVSSATISRDWNITQADLADHGGEALTLVGSLTKPDGSTVPIGANSANNGTQLNLSVYTGAGPSIVNSWDQSSITVPASGANGGLASIDFYLGTMGMDGTRSPVAAGTYTVNVSVKIGTTVVTSGENWGDPWRLSESSYNLSYEGSSIVAPSGATSVSFGTTLCLDSAKLTANSDVTVKAFVNGSDSQLFPNVSWYWRSWSNNWRNSPGGMPGTTTVSANDITYGLAAQVSFGTSATPGAASTATYQVLDANNADVSGSCAPEKPAKPTLAFNNGMFQASVALPKYADQMSSDCQLFDAAAPTVVVTTINNAYANMGTISCNFSSGLVTGKSYFVKIRGGYKSSVDGAWSDPSDSVVKTAAGVAFTTPISGINNAGGKLSLVSATIPADEDATPIITSSDGQNGMFVVASNSGVNSFGDTVIDNFKIRHITSAGANATFAGTGSLTVSAGANNWASNARISWYGARDKFALTHASYEMSASGTATLVVTTGSLNSATTATTTVAGSVFTNACVSALGSGYSAIQMGGMMSPPSVSVTPISAPTTTPLYQLSCGKMAMLPGGMGMTLNIPVLVTIADATTVNVVKALGTPGANVNTASASFSVNPNAGANDAAITVMARTALQTGLSTSTTDARTIYTIKKDLTVSTSAATWTSVASEPSIRLVPVNDGTVWGLLQEGSSYRLFKLAGETATSVNMTLDANADFTASSLAFPNGMQAGSSALLTVVRLNSPTIPTASALATLNTTTGAVTTYEVAKYTYTAGPGVVGSYMVEDKNMYWLMTDSANASKFSIYRWRDPAYVAQVAANQTITWTTSPTSVAVGGTTTVAATASSGLAVSYSSTDATKCTVNASTGVVTAVATSGTCTIKANQAGNDAFNAAPQQVLAINIAAVAPVKKAPRVPTIATKVKVGKTFAIALHATKGTAKTAANLDGLVTKVVLASSSKGFCSITPVIKSKKIAGYTVKGLKVNATKCAVTITITGNALFNSLTKTVKVNVTK